MTVYIEYVIIDNLVITALISLASYRVLKLSVNKIRITIATVLGTISAVLYPFFDFGVLWLLLIKFGVYKILSLTLFYKKTKLIKASLVFLFLTASFGGIMFAIMYIILGDATSALISPAVDFPIGVILLVPLIIYYLIKKVSYQLIGHRAAMDYQYVFEISIFDKSFSAKGFLDSGNLLIDRTSGLPVVIIGARLTAKILDEEQFGLVLRGRGEELGQGAHYISYTTLSSSKRLLVLKAKKFLLYLPNGANIIKEVMLGLSLSDIGIGHEALLSPAIF